VRAVRALSYAVVVLVVADPFLVHSLGFWLSTGATAGIALLAAPVAVLIPGPRIVKETTAVSLAAQAGVLPVLLLGGLGVPWVTPAANLLAVPVAEPITVVALPAAFVGASVPAVGAVPLHVAALLLAWVRAVAFVAHHHPVTIAAGAVSTVAVTVAVDRRASRRAPIASDP
jgi:competence protein ComEC